MNARIVNTVGLVALLASCLVATPATGQDSGTKIVNWIWFNEGDPAAAAPFGARYFRKAFNINRPVQKVVDEGLLDVTADNEFTAWINGVQVGKGNDWKRVWQFDIQKLLVHGQNVVAIEARNTEGAAGLLVRLGFIPNGHSKHSVVSDGTWKCSKTAAPGWQKSDFDDAQWSAAKVLGAYGQVGNWKGQVWDAGGDDRFAVPRGFAVEMVIPPNPKTEGLDPKLPFSLVNMTFDNKGRLLVSQERGPVLLCILPDKKAPSGAVPSIKPYCAQVKNCQGMCWVKDALLLVGDGPQGPGLYRVRDTNGDDQTDEVKLLHAFKGGMSEHGPHAIIHGPDGWLYQVIGNHSWAQVNKLAANSPLRRWPTGLTGPEQGEPGTTEDVLLKRLNDSRGHAADIRAPGGTIWRLDPEGKNLSLVAAGFRNHFDAAFNPQGELFTFDSDMEWDEALPWYRAVRTCPCPPGADFVWRTGAANTPDYYIDSLPPLAESGRGSPVGVEFYDHNVFPEKYRGAYFMADWAIGVIYAALLERDGGSYKAKVERFCVGNPLNVTDLGVGPDGALYFTLGGRTTQGGVYRIIYRDGANEPAATKAGVLAALDTPQPLAAWSQALTSKLYFDTPSGPKEFATALATAAADTRQSTARRIKALTLLQIHGLPLGGKLLPGLLTDKQADVQAHAVWLLGVRGNKESRDALVKALRDEDALVRRRSCEALIRAGIEPPVEAIWPLLDDKDRFVRTAARLVLERIDPEKWTSRLWQEKNDHTALEGIIALCKTNQAQSCAEPLFERLQKVDTTKDMRQMLDWLRTLQMALIHTTQRPATVTTMARECLRIFPHPDRFFTRAPDAPANRELAILLSYFSRQKILDGSIPGRLLAALRTSKDDRQQQIHYFYCLRLLSDGWTAEQKSALLAWYDSTKTWQGGHSFTPFLENILRDLNGIFTADERSRIIAKGDELSLAATALLRMASPEQVPAPDMVAGLYARLLESRKPGPQINDLKTALIDALGRSASSQAAAALRTIGDRDPSQRDTIARSLARFPTAENWPYLVRGLESANPLVIYDVIEGLKKSATRPKPEEAAPYRALLLASRRLDDKNRWKAVELLRHWSNGKQFGAEPGDWKVELTSWSRWFNQTFAKETPLPDVAAEKAESKYKFEELLSFLEKDPAGRQGDVARGRLVFEKAQCLKCHKFGKEGEGIGPDLTTLSKRFKRVDILDSILYPSKVISDQYRSSLIETRSGQRLTGLAAPQGDLVTVLLSDGAKVTLKKNEIDQQFASLLSVMPDKLLDMLTKAEVADLFAFMESEPK